jgi:hypothetical protein
VAELAAYRTGRLVRGELMVRNPLRDCKDGGIFHL